MRPFRIAAASAAGLVAFLAGCAQSAGPKQVTEVSGVKNLSRDGRIYVAGAPTPEGLRQLKQRGVTTVIDLRTETEAGTQEAQAAQAEGLNYIHIPMASDKLTEQQIDAFMEAMQTSDGDPVLVHCASGNRAGAMYGLYLGKSGQCPASEALRRAKAAGLKNEKLETDVAEALDDAPPEPENRESH